MEETIKKIQVDILNSQAPLSMILLQAKVLAYELGNDCLKRWVKNEIEGYDDVSEVPHYRILSTQSFGDQISDLVYHSGTNLPIPIFFTNLPSWLIEAAGTLRIPDGVRSIEELAKRGQDIIFSWQAEWIAILNQTLGQSRNAVWQNIYRPVSQSVFAQILDTIRSRLQDFVLGLDNIHWLLSLEQPTNAQVNRLVEVKIYNKFVDTTQNTYMEAMTMSKNEVNIGRKATVHGNVLAANSVRDSFNQIQNTKMSDELKATLAKLEKYIEAVVPHLLEKQAKQVAQDINTLCEEANKEQPRKKWWELALEEIRDIAITVGDIGKPIIELLPTITTLLSSKNG